MDIEKLYPECMDNIWGGVKLKEKYGKITDKNPCAESWELSFHKSAPTKISTGEKLADVVKEEDLGTNILSFPFFPTLIKFIDAKGNLSIQVHPSDDYAIKNENSFGKTEMWYIVEAEEGAGIYLGFNKDVAKDEFEKAIKNNTITDLLNFYPVKKGECYFIPSGTIHAINSGCLICEIQQNSNITYRVYDYGRKDKNGKERELHIEKALAVTNLKKYERKVFFEDILGISKYFTVKKLEIKENEPLNLETDSTTFNCICCVSGSGYINNKPVSMGDSYFVPANFGKYTLSGNMTVIFTEIRKYYIGIDLGGTFIKGAIVDDKGKILVKYKVPTEKEKGENCVCENIVTLCNTLIEKANITKNDICEIGIGVPGTINSVKGEVTYSNNLKWEHFNIKNQIEKLTSLPVKIANDANCACLGEWKFGFGKKYNNVVFITLGTGVGSGIIANGKLYEGNGGAGAEFGHMVICENGEKCTCGRQGCFEAYSSATALIRDTKSAMLNHKNSKMWKIGSLENVDGETAFNFMDEDEFAKAVVDNYIDKLSLGVINIANILRPDAIIIGGGVSSQGDRLRLPIQNKVNSEIFGKEKGPKVEIVMSTLKNDAGILGAVALLTK